MERGANVIYGDNQVRIERERAMQISMSQWSVKLAGHVIGGERCKRKVGVMRSPCGFP
jgi:hypothetical protein